MPPGSQKSESSLFSSLYSYIASGGGKFYTNFGEVVTESNKLFIFNLNKYRDNKS